MLSLQFIFFSGIPEYHRADACPVMTWMTICAHKKCAVYRHIIFGEYIGVSGYIICHRYNNCNRYSFINTLSVANVHPYNAFCATFTCVYIWDTLSVVDALLMADALCTVDTFSALHILYYYDTNIICSRHNICGRHIIWQICILLIIYTLFKADTDTLFVVDTWSGRYIPAYCIQLHCQWQIHSLKQIHYL